MKEAALGLPVRLHGVVTALSGWKTSFFFQDGTSGISVDRGTDSPELRPGEMVEVLGVTGPGLFAPAVAADSVKILGPGKFPPARLFDFGGLAGGNQDSQFLAIRGIVRSAAVKPSWGRPVLFLEIDIGSGNLVTARVHDFPQTGWESLNASTVLVRGVCGTVFNDRRQFVGLRLFVANLNDITVERPAPTDPFEGTARPLGSLLQFGDKGGTIKRVKLRGIVSYYQPGHGLYIQDESQGVFVESLQTTAVALGSRLEVLGYPAAGRYSPKLDDSIFRVAGTTKAPVGLALSASQMLIDQSGFAAAPYDGLLVQLKGRLIERIPGIDEDLLLFQDGASVFNAKLPHPRQRNQTAELTSGSLLRVTGVCLAKADERHEARSFEILLRSADDLTILEKAPWWTASHAGWVVVPLVVLILAMSGCLALLRWRNRLHNLTVTDPLTGVYNRRGFLLLAEQQWQLALRSKRPCAVFYIDVDCFKEINDVDGHKAGDVALQDVAAVLRATFRNTDLVGRLGGDEFAVTAIDMSVDHRAQVEERLAKGVEFSNEKTRRKIRLSLSVGTLTCDQMHSTLSIEALLAQADTLMYEQKRSRGANRTRELAVTKDRGRYR